MRLRKDAEILDPQIERELSELEAEFGAELRELRAVPRPEFAAELDERAAAGFGGGASAARPARPAPGSASAPRRSGRQLLPVGGEWRLAAVVVATAIVAASARSRAAAIGRARPSPARSSPAAVAAGGGSPRRAEYAARSPSRTEPLEAVPLSRRSRRAPGRRSGRRHRPLRRRRARIATTRRSAQLTLGTEPAEVREVADDVFGVVGRYDGIVLSSSVSDGAAGRRRRDASSC